MGGIVGSGGSVVVAAGGSRMGSAGGAMSVGDVKIVASTKTRLSCQLCGRMFGQMEDLRRHFRTHTGEKPYTCPYCPYRAAVKSSVIRHARTIHGATATSQNILGV